MKIIDWGLGIILVLSIFGLISNAMMPDVLQPSGTTPLYVLLIILSALLLIPIFIGRDHDGK